MGLFFFFFKKIYVYHISYAAFEPSHNNYASPYNILIQYCYLTVCYAKRFGPRGIGHGGGSTIGLTCDLHDRYQEWKNKMYLIETLIFNKRILSITKSCGVSQSARMQPRRCCFPLANLAHNILSFINFLLYKAQSKNNDKHFLCETRQH